MRAILAPLGLAFLAVACGGGPSPRDLSNARVPTTQAYAETNLHATDEVEPSPRVLAILAEPDRADADEALDAPRQAADLLTFLGVGPQMRVAELGCGTGYMTELLARAVGPRGAVFAQNAPVTLANESVATAWRERLAKPVNANVLRVERSFGDPLPPTARELDLVFLSIDYGQLARHGVDRDAMNHAVQLALRTGGRYVVLDETPAQGAHLTDLHVLHAEESRNARREIESAGFVFAAEGRFLRSSADGDDWDANSAANPLQEKRDRFVLVFDKP